MTACFSLERDGADMNPDWIFQIMFGVSFMISLTFLAIIVYRNVRSYFDRKKLEHASETREKIKIEDVIEGHPDQHSTRLSDLRFFGYKGFENLKDVKYTNYFIREKENEALGIFVTLSPDIIGIISKLEKALFSIDEKLSVDSDLDNGFSVPDHIEKIGISLEALLRATEELTERIFTITQDGRDERTEIPLEEDIIKVYIRVSSSLITMAFNYLQISNEVRKKLEDLMPSMFNHFEEIQDVFLKLFFVDLTNCITMLDKSIEVYNWTRKEE